LRVNDEDFGAQRGDRLQALLDIFFLVAREDEDGQVAHQKYLKSLRSMRGKTFKKMAGT
jgi:hypothetical protein